MGQVEGLASPPLPPEHHLVRLGPRQLASAALTHPATLVAGPAWFAVLGFVAWRTTTGDGTSDAGALFAMVPLVAVLGFLVASQLYASVVGRHDFTVSVIGDDLHLRYGVLQVRNLTLPRRRIQQVTVTDNPLRRLAGLASIRLHSASIEGGGEQATTRFEIPLVARVHVDATIAALLGSDAWRCPPMQPRPPAARRRAIVRRTAPLVVVLAAPAVLFGPAALALLPLALLGIPWGLAAHRLAGVGTSTSLVAVSHGVMNHRVDLVPLARVQSCRLERSPLQRRARLATLHIDVAGLSRSDVLSTPRLRDIGDADGERLMAALPRAPSVMGRSAQVVRPGPLDSSPPRHLSRLGA